MSLPPELRLQIFEHALPARIVPIFAMPVARHEGPPHLQYHGYNGDPLGTLKWETYVECLFTNPHPLPPLRRVNREMRHLHESKTKAAIESFKPSIPYNGRNMVTYPRPNKSSLISRFYERAVRKHQASRKYSFIEPKIDVYFLQDYPGLPRSTIDTMVRWLDRRSMENLTRLAVLHHTWQAAVVEGFLCALREFLGLEELWIVFSREEDNVVIDLQLAKKDVVEKLGELAGGDNKWEVPRVRFADDEGCLEELVRR
jgi:hypothetical protein